MPITDTTVMVLEAHDKASDIIDHVIQKLHGIGPASDQSTASVAKLAEQFAKAHPAMIATGVAGAATAIAVGKIGFDAVKAAADFQESMTQLVTGAGEARENIGLVSDGVLKMARDTGVSADEIAKGMYLVESAGFHGAAGLEVMKSAAEGAKVGNADMQVVANAVTTALNAYGLKADDAATITSKMVATVASGKMHMEDFSGSLSAVLPVAAAAHISFDEIGGAMATMTAQGMSAEQASQDLANMIRNLQSVNGPALNMMQQLGINVTDLEQHLGERGLTGTIEIVSDAIKSHLTKEGLVAMDAMKLSASGVEQLHNMLQKMPPDLAELGQKFIDGHLSMKNFQKAFKDLGGEGYAEGKQFLALAQNVDGFNNNVRAGKPVMLTAADALKLMLGGATGLNVGLMLGNEHMDTFVNNVHTISGATADAQGHVKGWAEIQEDFNTKLAQAGQAFDTLKISIGQALLPVVTDLMGKVSEFMGPIADWVSHNKELAAVIMLVVGAVGALVFVVTLLTAAFAILAANPVVVVITLIVIAIAGLVAALIYAYNHVGWFKDMVDTAFHAIGDVVTTVWNWLKTNVFDPLATTFREVIGPAMQWFWQERVVPAWNGIQEVIGKVWGWLSTYVFPAVDVAVRMMAGVYIWLWKDNVVPAWNGIQELIGGAWNWLKSNVFDPLVWLFNNVIGPVFMWFWHNVIEPVWRNVSATMTDEWNWMRDHVFHPIEDAVHSMSGAFEWGRDRIRDAWEGIKNAAREPARFVIDTVYNDGIRNMWNTIASLVGVQQLDRVGVPFAKGGVVPGYSPGNDIIHAILSPGEGILIPQAVRALGGAAGIDAINRMFGGGGRGDGMHFAGGGVIGDILGAVGGAFSSLANAVLGGVQAAATPIIQYLEGLADGSLGTSSRNLSGAFDHGVHMLGDGILAWLGGKDSAAKSAQAASIGSPGAVSGDLAGWVQAAMAAAGVTGAAWLNGLETIAQYESGGNPNAENDWDSNAAMGDPSRGLMQTIGSTFEAYRLAGLPNNIFDPVANVAAAIGYIQSRYGGIGGVPGLVSLSQGGGYVGYDNGGFLEPGFTLAYNGTGKREPVGAGGINIRVVVTGNNIWDERALQKIYDELGRKIATELLPQAGIQIRR